MRAASGHPIPGGRGYPRQRRTQHGCRKASAPRLFPRSPRIAHKAPPGAGRPRRRLTCGGTTCAAMTHNVRRNDAPQCAATTHSRDGGAGAAAFYMPVPSGGD